MLVIRLARTGRTKYPTYRIVAAEKARATTGKFVAILGNYNPHTKELVLKKDEITRLLGNGAQPSNSVIKLLQREKVELPKWAVLQTKTRAPKKEVVKEEKPEAPAAEDATDAGSEDTTPEVVEEATDAPAEEASEAPAVETVATTAEANAEAVEANVTESAAEDTAAGEEAQAEVAEEVEDAAAQVAAEETPDESAA
jgi:small subunit ribosomal protein S16